MVVKDSFVLMISEKPQAAMRISLALAEGNVRRKEYGNTYWFEFERNGIKHACVPAVGHLFVLDTEGKGWKYPVFDTQWIPSFKRKGAQFTKNYFRNLEIAAGKANDFIVCCDYDTEGEVIGYNILRFICKREDAKRMKFSTLTKGDIIDAYENMMDHIDFGQAEAGLTRHYLDFLWGINTTRALTLALKSGMKSGFALVSTGRVQGPTLAILAQREREIKTFKPISFWELEFYVMFGRTEVMATYEKNKIWDKEEAELIYNSCKGKDATVKNVEKKKYKVNPPIPFDTTILQTESYRCFGYSPSQTLSIAESLYTQGYISYPRTSNQQLPEKIGFKNILQSLSKLSIFKKNVASLLTKKELKPTQGKKTDPAHPAIYPTSQIPELSRLTSQQRRLYELIVRRFLAVFGDSAVRESNKVTLDLSGYIFYAKGQRTIEPGWIDLYGRFAVIKEQVLPEVNIGDKLKVKDLLLLSKETQPPARYSQASILKEMEKRGLGTKATRAQILQTLYDRGYIHERNIQVTKFGQAVIEVLEKYSPRIINEELTRKFEEEMENVRLGNKKREEIVEEAKGLLVDILEDFKKHESEIGEDLVKSYSSIRQALRIIGKCPNCGKGLIMIRSKSSKKRFIGCSGYKDGCKFTAPLPQSGTIIPTDKLCKECNYPVILLRFKKRKPFMSCINMKCPTKKTQKD